MHKIIMLVGPAGAGKSTLAKEYEKSGYVRINQDSQGREHLALFDRMVEAGHFVVVDRMNFTRQQRERFLGKAKKHGYTSKIIVLHESYEVCLERCLKREGHETIKEEKGARAALNMFFSKYERVEDDEADMVERRWPEGDKPDAIICDLDGTLCDITHRLHFVHPPEGQKKDWKAFFEGMKDDKANKWCEEILHLFRDRKIVLCSGRPDNYRRSTDEWLRDNLVEYDYLFMRNRGDHRQDYIAKEIILDFEILTRFTPYFMIDDREQVVKMWRRRGFTCLQCNEGAF
jgi:predicted kinase